MRVCTSQKVCITLEMEINTFNCRINKDRIEQAPEHGKDCCLSHCSEVVLSMSQTWRSLEHREFKGHPRIKPTDLLLAIKLYRVRHDVGSYSFSRKSITLKSLMTGHPLLKILFYQENLLN